ncbi:glycosyltransferase [Mycobacterium sp. 360MFTsu5.1]|uniref:glycosyltransferase n=1 Tax=Mycobacterium sp. 360MFTsu5.1 TaxID=1172186 RepID=UPI0009DB6FD1|nr:glycosyltransferase [Mycobacterium sp. 360MFTsu5.1]
MLSADPDLPVSEAGSRVRDVSLSIIVCAYTTDRIAQLTNCVDALLLQMHSDDEIVVVIDYNTQLYETMADRYGDRVIVNTRVRGLSGARNSGIARASRDVLAFVDDDAEIQPGWADKLRAHYRDPEVAGVGGYAEPVWPAAGRPEWFPVEYDWVVGCSHRGLPVSVTRVRNFIGCNMSFRNSVFAEVGEFNVDVGRLGSRPVGCEETELCIRLSQARPAARLLFDPAISVRHSVTPERARLRYFLDRCFSEGLSKHRVSGMVGSSDALSTERRYVTSVLPSAFLGGLRDALVGRGSRRAACARSAVVLVGLLVTTIGYGYAMLRSPDDDEATTREDRRDGAGTVPGGHHLPLRAVSIEELPLARTEIELSDPPTEVLLANVRRAHQNIYALISLHGHPLGTVILDGAKGVAWQAHTAVVWESLHEQINAHLAADGLPCVATIEALGAQTSAVPRCLRDRADVLADPPAITVIVATRDRPDTLRTCLQTLLAVDYPTFEVLVVDNDPSSDATQTLIAGEFAGRVRYVREDRRGLSWAHNRGLEETTTDIVAFADDDVIVDPGWLTAIAEGFASGEDVGCVTGLILPSELETPAQLNLEWHGGFSKGFARRTYDMRGNRPDDPLFPFAIGRLGSGANMAFDTDVLRRLGGFDPAIGIGTTAKGGDDLASFFRVVVRHQLVYQPAAVVWHRHPREMSALSQQAFRYGVGFGAYMTSAIVHEPRMLGTLMRQLPAGVAFAASSMSSRDRKQSDDWPVELARWEKLGMLSGPLAYGVSRWRSRRARVGTST